MSVNRLQISELAAQLRIDSIRCTTEAGSGHPTSSMSAADLMAVLMSNYLRYDWHDPHEANNDRLIFSKGHASPLLYSMYRAAGMISDEELLSLRKFRSRLEGHPKPHRHDGAIDDQHGLPWIDVATGSLGQGLPIAVGMGIVGKHIDKLPFHIWVLMGDGEMAEGSVWEAFDKSSFYGLSNVTAIVDVNRLGQQGPTDLGWNVEAYTKRVKAFGWHAIEIDGHDSKAIDAAYQEALDENEKPTCILAKTVKGSGFYLVADKEGWHGKTLSGDQAADAIKELGGERGLAVSVQKPKCSAPSAQRMPTVLKLPVYEVGTEEATRKAFGDALAALGAANPDVMVLDGEVSNSTYTDLFKQTFPERFFEMFIAEQQLVGAALGMSVLGKISFAATFAAFLTRAFDQIRMAAVSGASLRLCGSHVGVSIGEDGPSQMGLEDIAMMRTIHDSTVLYPCDANQTSQLVKEMAKAPGISYLRTSRGKMPVIYRSDEEFRIGGSKVVRRSSNDQVAIIAAGITLHESLRSFSQLQSYGIRARVIDLYSIKPIDIETLHEAAQDTGGNLVVVEDHWADGGIGDAVLDAFTDMTTGMPSVTKLAVRSMPGSGTPQQQLSAAGIDAEHITQAVRLCMRAKHRADISWSVKLL